MNKTFRWFPLAVAGYAVLLSGCVTTEQRPDGSTSINIPSILQRNPPPTTATTNQQPVQTKPAPITNKQQAPIQKVGTIQFTSLANLFTKYPFDGTAKTYFPKVAVTVTDWTSPDCWSATAKIWYSKTKSENVPSFTVCFNKSFGFALNNAANLHLFFGQNAFEHSGNVRSDGPKPPMMAVPDRFPFGDKWLDINNLFVQQLVVDTGWKPGAPTNIWIVGYNATPTPTSTPAASAPTAASATPNLNPITFDAQASQALVSALTCTSIGKSIEKVDATLLSAGVTSGINPFFVNKPIKLFGLSTSKVAVSRDGFEQIYRAYFAGAKLQDVVKAAALKLGNDKKGYGKATKIGVLTADQDLDGVSLTCTVQSESE